MFNEKPHKRKQVTSKHSSGANGTIAITLFWIWCDYFLLLVPQTQHLSSGSLELRQLSQSHLAKTLVIQLSYYHPLYLPPVEEMAKIKSWFMVRVHLLNYGYKWGVAEHEKCLRVLRGNSRVQLWLLGSLATSQVHP